MRLHFITFFTVFKPKSWSGRKKGHNPGLIAHSTVNGEEESGTLQLVCAAGKLRFFLGSDTQRTVNARIILLINCPTLISIPILCRTCK